jgi:hypothetical protein
LFPKRGYRRLLDGTIVHDVTTDVNEFHLEVAKDEMTQPPPRILEERGRGTEICNQEDQDK